METERHSEVDREHADTIAEVLGLIRAKLVEGAYDVLNNHHEDILRISSGDEMIEHRLTQTEARQIDQAAWSAGEDQTLDGLMNGIRRELVRSGFHLTGDHLDVTVHLEEVPLASPEN